MNSFTIFTVAALLIISCTHASTDGDLTSLMNDVTAEITGIKNNTVKLSLLKAEQTTACNGTDGKPVDHTATQYFGIRWVHPMCVAAMTNVDNMLKKIAMASGKVDTLVKEMDAIIQAHEKDIAAQPVIDSTTGTDDEKAAAQVKKDAAADMKAIVDNAKEFVKTANARAAAAAGNVDKRDGKGPESSAAGFSLFLAAFLTIAALSL